MEERKKSETYGGGRTLESDRRWSEEGRGGPRHETPGLIPTPPLACLEKEYVRREGGKLVPGPAGRDVCLKRDASESEL